MSFMAPLLPHICVVVLVLTLAPPGACVRAEKAPLSFLGTQFLGWAPRKHN